MFGGRDPGNGGVVDGVLQSGGAADGVIDGREVEGACIDVVLRQVLREVLALDLQAVMSLFLCRAFDHVLEGRADVEVADAHGVRVGDDGIGRVSVHL